MEIEVPDGQRDDVLLARPPGEAGVPYLDRKAAGAEPSFEAAGPRGRVVRSQHVEGGRAAGHQHPDDAGGLEPGALRRAVAEAVQRCPLAENGGRAPFPRAGVEVGVTAVDPAQEEDLVMEDRRPGSRPRAVPDPQGHPQEALAQPQEQHRRQEPQQQPAGDPREGFHGGGVYPVENVKHLRLLVRKPQMLQALDPFELRVLMDEFGIEHQGQGGVPGAGGIPNRRSISSSISRSFLLSLRRSSVVGPPP